MKRTLVSLTTAVALSTASLVAMPAVAMDQELSMLETALNRGLSAINVDVDTSTLTFAQLAQIKNVLESSESTTNKAQRVRAIVDDGPIITEQLGMLELSVTRSLEKIGVEGVIMSNLSLTQLNQIKNVLESGESTNEQARRVNAIIEDRPVINEELNMLELAASRALGQIGLDDVDTTTLSLTQLSQLQSIFGSDESTNEKARKAKAIIGN